MKTGLVVLNYNAPDLLAVLVDMAVQYDTVNNIVIVDNNSPDGSGKSLYERYKEVPKVEVILSGENRGYSAGNNIGAKWLIDNTDVDIIAIANPDVTFEESLVKGISRVFEESPGYGLLSGVMMRPDGSVDKFPYRERFGFWHDLGDCFITVRRMVYEKKVFEIDFSKEVMDVPVIQGSFFAMPKKVYQEIGGLDEELFLYYEEMVLAAKLERAGYKTGIITGESYIHNHSVSIKRSMKNVAVWRTVLKSKHYYEKKYNQTGPIGMFVLRFFGFFSLFEKFLIEVLRCL